MCKQATLFLALLMVITGLTYGQEDEVPATLESYDAAPSEVIAELESLGLIETGGRLLFQVDEAFASGQGESYIALAYPAVATDLVMAAQMTFTGEDAGEAATCGLIARIDRVGRRAASFVDVAITNTGDLAVFDVRGLNEAPTTDETISLALDLTQPHHFLFLLLHDTATVYVDGELAVTDVPVFVQRGTHGILLRNEGAAVRCEAQNIWAYEVPPPTNRGECVVRGGSYPTNRRRGPGTNFAVVGRMVNRDILDVQGQAIGRDGLVWWQLEDESWVRDDVVDAVGDCDSVPTVEP